ncbi:MAG: NADH-quinone oxidoreductase subunit J [Planctomycetes bacterium]|nr:NADH-quinone oxidoreductase subunit J [Planctomycetota bacterium]
MGLAIIAAVGAVLLRNLFHAGLALVLVLVAIAGIFMSVGAEFLGMVQILLYVGGVMTLIIYTIMLTGRLGAKDVSAQNRQGIFAAVAAGLFVCVIGKLILEAAWPSRDGDSAALLSVEDLGVSLMTEYVFPFEVLGVLLFAVLIGAIVIARQDRPS